MNKGAAPRRIIIRVEVLSPEGVGALWGGLLRVYL